MIKAWVAEFRRAYAAARTRSVAKAQPAPLIESPEFRTWLQTIVADAYAAGVLHERARIAAAALEHATVDHPTESHAPESATLH
jgi:hypothetical protein